MSESISQGRPSRTLRWKDRPIGNFLTKHAVAGSFLLAIAALALQSAPAMAQQQARTQSVEIFGGELFGDKLTDRPVSGRNPRLNDDALAGIRYNYSFTDMWGVQLSSGYSWSRDEAARQGLASRINYRQNRWSPSKYMGFRVKAGWLKLPWVANQIRKAATRYLRALADGSHRINAGAKER